MAVPAHDERDLEFARTFDLPVKEVVQPPQTDGACPWASPARGRRSTRVGTPACRHRSSNRRSPPIWRRADSAERPPTTVCGTGSSRGSGTGVSRFPSWHELDADGNPTGLTRPVPVDQLPVTLPEMEDYKPKGTPDPPLNHAPDEWLFATADDGTRLKRETNSMPQWAGSCWYYLRFADSQNDAAFIDPAVEKYWLPVDLYIGGAEHAVLHLLYSRFWHKVLV